MQTSYLNSPDIADYNKVDPPGTFTFSSSLLENL